MTTSEHELRRAYPDLPIEDDPVMLRVVRDLDAAYRRPRFPQQTPPAMLHAHGSSEPAAVPMAAVHPRGLRTLLPRKSRRARARPARWMFRPMVVVTVLLTVTAVLAAGSQINLGKPTNAVSPLDYFPLDNFRPTHATLRQYGLPEFLFLSVKHDPVAGVQSWPIVKALEQFGTLSGVTPIERACHNVPGFGRLPGGVSCSFPALNLSRAVYRSRYLRFVYGIAGGYTNKPVRYPGPLPRFRWSRGLPAQEKALFQRYACTPRREPCTGPTARVAEYLEIPGSYFQTSTQFMVPNEITLPVATMTDSLDATPTFAQVQRALVSNTEPAPNTVLVLYINAESNILTALLCHADGKRPATVCAQPAIQAILKHVK
jgi:hypothetical protein